jgi:hypothetical protein
MQGVPDSFDHSVDQADYKVVPQHPGVELFRAHIVRHAFELHTHEHWGHEHWGHMSIGVRSQI